MKIARAPISMRQPHPAPSMQWISACVGRHGAEEEGGGDHRTTNKQKTSLIIVVMATWFSGQANVSITR